MATFEDPAFDELGPVDYAVIEFPAGHRAFTGQLADELLRLVDTETVNILDLLVINKGLDGTVEAVEIDESGERDDVCGLQAYVAEILAVDDVVALAAAMEPGSVAGVVVWENTWAAPFASAVRGTGGKLVATGRVPLAAIRASLEASLVVPAARAASPLMEPRARGQVLTVPVVRAVVGADTARVIRDSLSRRRGRHARRRDGRGA